MLENKWKFFLGIVLDLAGMELTFPTAAAKEGVRGAVWY